MSSILAKLKKSSRTSLENIAKQVKDDDTKNSYRDERYWQPVVDKANNGNATIRFLPPVSEPTKLVAVPEDVPYVRIYKHGFKDKGGWYIENSLTTIGKQDPISELNSEYWNSGIESKKKIASKRKRRLLYISNILVVKHPARQEDEGKVFLFAYPKQIYDKIKNKLTPEEDDIESINVFDLWEGCNFRLRVRDKEGFRNYETSEFDSPSPISDDDEDIERVYNSQYSLQAEIAPDKFKSYDELKKQLDRALGKSSGSSAAEEPDDEDGDEDAEIVQRLEAATPSRKKVVVDTDDDDGEPDEPLVAPKKVVKKAPVVDEDDDTDDEADFFKKLKARKK